MMALRFYAVSAQIYEFFHVYSGFLVLFLGFLELNLWETWIQVTMAVL